MRPDSDGLNFTEVSAGDYGVTFRVAHPLAPTGEPSDYVVDIDCEIHAPSGDAPGPPIGWLSARLVQAGRAGDNGEALHDVCDSVDQELYDYAASVYNFDQGCIRDSVADCIGADLLIIQSVQILRAHRRRRLGLLAVLRTIDTFGGGCGAVLIKPWPLQFSLDDRGLQPESDVDQLMSMGSFSNDEQVALAKLEHYWQRLGFARVGSTEYFLLNLCLNRPTYSDILV